MATPNMARSNSNKQSVQHIKICLIGDSDVGKTCIATRLIRNIYNPLTSHSIGAAYGTKDIEVEDQTFRIHVWDTAGQERYTTLVPLYYRNTHAAIIVYDITHPKSFSSVKAWSKEINLHTSPEILLAIAGNKCDLQENRVIQKKTGKQCAEELGAIYFETSAVDGTNIQEMFHKIVRKIHRKSIFKMETEEAVPQENVKPVKCACM